MRAYICGSSVTVPAIYKLPESYLKFASKLQTCVRASALGIISQGAQQQQRV